ncbi:hypothetical protein HYPSUDRAFT_39022 [Hypholoma sublateritium FD-334 SS-4]|uniref:Uncharacterized protein n=1 Tax=Hypholoma sublateritium (strain FD-334 SS-4) TaxID=945553 RepID=A0A0D2P013_HYPSF|nr:hypothetical protein HYPSUDRAFT_39022 [Hypholoma sublateritium FD-334 SS-4]
MEGPPVYIQKAVLSTELNSNMLGALLFGVDTVVYSETLYMYLTSKSSQSRIVLATITLLYLVFTAQFTSQWFGLNQSFIEDGDTRFDILNSGSSWSIPFNNICSLLFSALADGLLIWRCYNVWGKSVRAIIASLVFLVAEIGLYFYLILIDLVPRLTRANNAAILHNNLLSAAFFMTLGSTLLTTILIAYRIHSVAKSSTAAPTKRSRTYSNIGDLIVQSAAPYAFMSLIYAIAVVIPTSSDAVYLTRIYPLVGYVSLIFSFTASAAPTIMVARIVSASNLPVEDFSSARMSDLEFRVQPSAAHGSQAMMSTLQALGSHRDPSYTSENA